MLFERFALGVEMLVLLRFVFQLANGDFLAVFLERDLKRVEVLGG